MTRERAIEKRRRRPGWVRRLGMAAQNAIEIVRAGRLSAPYGAPFEVVHSERVFALRRYDAGGDVDAAGADAPLLLVPPLMVAAEVYDISPDTSAVAALLRAGVDVWMVDFGAPEEREGGMERTLDDHVRAVDRAVDLVREATGHDVHLSGYSQGGMFVYQCAAYRRSRGLASLITFGSPVDIHRNLPNVGDSIAQRIIGAARTAIELPLQRIEGLPGYLTSTGFKLMSARKEVQQMFDFVRKLHDRQALEKREARRLFLGGEGFVAWPGPALRTFIDEIIVHNRMASGGIVIAGRTVTLADIRCPILCFVGSRDDMARPPSVRAIHRAAPNAEVYEVTVKAGHFGLVVGSTALRVTWPTVVGWMAWQEDAGPRPELLPAAGDGEVEDYDPDDIEAAFEEVQFDLELFSDVIISGAETLWNKLGDALGDVGDTVDDLRAQLPRLRRLRRLRGGSRVSMALALAERAAEIGDHTFFLWRGRAFSYDDANRRVDNVVRGFLHLGVTRGQRVGLLMGVRPSFLVAVTALNRIGAVAVLLNPDARRLSLERAAELGEVSAIVADPEQVRRAREAFDGPVWVLGGGGPQREIDPGAVDMEAIDPDAVELPPWYEPNPGTSRDMALVIFSAGRTGEPRAAHITNRRWAFSAYGAAAACTLTRRDTVYCPLPLHHAAGSMVSVGGALVGGSRLALATTFDPNTFWTEVRRYGATVVFYGGEMCRELAFAPPAAGEQNHPVRLFAGSGMRADVWRRLQDRFGHVGVLEFYASTEGNAVLANASGEKIGSVGRPLPGSVDMEIVRWDFDFGAPARDGDRLLRCATDEVGMLVTRLDDSHPAARSGGSPRRLVRGAFADGDVWFVTGDLMRRDTDGDYWFVDRARDAIRTPAGPQWTTSIEDALYRAPGVRLAVAYGLPAEDGAGEVPTARVVLASGVDPGDAAWQRALADAVAELPRAARPRHVLVVDQVPMTDGYRPLKAPLRREGTAAEANARAVLTRNDDARRYDISVPGSSGEAMSTAEP